MDPVSSRLMNISFVQRKSNYKLWLLLWQRLGAAHRKQHIQARNANCIHKEFFSEFEQEEDSRFPSSSIPYVALRLSLSSGCIVTQADQWNIDCQHMAMCLSCHVTYIPDSQCRFLVCSMPALHACIHSETSLHYSPVFESWGSPPVIKV